MPLPPEVGFLLAVGCVALLLALARSVGRRRARREVSRQLEHTWGQDQRSGRAGRPLDAWWRQIEARQTGGPDGTRQETPSDEGQPARREAIKGRGPPLDAQTWRDLGMDGVFAWADRTLTALGAQVLWSWLRSPDPELKLGRARRELAEALSADPTQRVALQEVLLRVGDRLGWDVAKVLRERSPELPLPLWTYRLLAAALGLALVAAGLWPGVISMSALAVLVVVNPILHVQTSRRIDPILVSLRDLRALVLAAGRAHAVVGEGARRLLGEAGPDVTAARAAVAQGGLTLQVARSGAGTFADTLLEYGRAFFLSDARAYLRVVDAVERHRPHLIRALRLLGECDAALALAYLRTTRADLVEPERTEQRARLVARAVAHPLLRPATPNDATLGPRGLLVTGSNMAGKSTFLRTLGVNVVLAQALGVACAEFFACGPLRVFASTGASDDLQASVSLYQAEVMRIRELLDEGARQPPCLFLLDELFRGTNPRDRVAASCAVLRHLADGNVLVAATHDLELAGLTAERLDVGHFSERVRGDGVVFDYRLHPGLSQQTNALQLLSRLGYPATVVTEAQAVAERIGSDGAVGSGRYAPPSPA